MAHSELTKQIVKEYKDQIGRTIERNDERIADLETEVKVIEAENDILKARMKALDEDIEEPEPPEEPEPIEPVPLEQ